MLTDSASQPDLEDRTNASNPFSSSPSMTLAHIDEAPEDGYAWGLRKALDMWVICLVEVGEQPKRKD